MSPLSISLGCAPPACDSLMTLQMLQYDLQTFQMPTVLFLGVECVDQGICSLWTSLLHITEVIDAKVAAFCKTLIPGITSS